MTAPTPSSFALPCEPASFAAATEYGLDLHDLVFMKAGTRDRGLSLSSVVRASSPSRHRGGSLASNVSEPETAFLRFRNHSRSNIALDELSQLQQPQQQQSTVVKAGGAPVDSLGRRYSVSSNLSELDAEHTPSPTGNSVSTPTTTMPSPHVGAPTVLVVDPLSRKLAIPRTAIRDTLATCRPGVPSLCLLYTSNKCRQGNQCHQIHADPQVVHRLRAEAKSHSTCCGEHGDVHGHLCRPEWASRSIEINGTVIPHSQLAYTGALAKLYNDNPTTMRLSVPLQLVCRLHGSERCRYSDDCRFIHICRHVLRQHFSGSVEDLIPQLEIRHQAVAAMATSSSSRGPKPHSPPSADRTPPPPAAQQMASASTSPHSFVAPIAIPSPTSATVLVGNPQFQHQQQQQQQQQQQRMRSTPVTPSNSSPVVTMAPLQQAHQQQARPLQSSTPTWMQLGNPAQPVFIAHPASAAPTTLAQLPNGAGYVLVPLQSYNAMLGAAPQAPSPTRIVMLAPPDNSSPFQLHPAS